MGEISLGTLASGVSYRMVRDAFETHSLLYFPNQQIDDETHLRIGRLFGPREDRTIDPDQPLSAVSLVSNQDTDGGVISPNDRHLKNLQANMLWHTDSTFLPTPALANILIARELPPSGTATQFVSTRAAWADMPDSIKQRIRGRTFRHRYSHSRAKVDPDLSRENLFTHWRDQHWQSVWTNPVNGEEALYIASHACGVSGMDDEAGQRLVDELIDWCTQEQYVYTHHWKPGDVLIWDERATMHRGVPWNYDEPRTLASICISATAADGLESVRA